MKFHDECGVFGIFNHTEAARLTYLGLHALQHRGQESAGIVSADAGRLHAQKGMGQVAEVFRAETLAGLPGRSAIGHVRYSTTGQSLLVNAQPITIDSHRGEVALCHNGNLVNALTIREQLRYTGSIFQSTSDSEVILHLYARSRQDSVEDAILDALHQVRGAFTLLFISADKIIAVRDPSGFRPLSMGRLDDATIFCSETCALDLINAEHIRDVEPGEMLIVSKDGMKSLRAFESERPAQCIFEQIYFARPDSVMFGRGVSDVRVRLGRQLAQESFVPSDLVVPVPDSGIFAGIGYAVESGVPYVPALIRNHYVGRTFIEPKQSIRHFGVKLKLNPVASLIKGQAVTLIDDSIVRGTTSRKIVEMIRAAGAREVHFRISSPPTRGSCYYGIDTPTREELIASSHDVDGIRKFIDADTLAYLSVEGMHRATYSENDFCDACFTGRYPVKIEQEEFEQMRLFEQRMPKDDRD